MVSTDKLRKNSSQSYENGHIFERDRQLMDSFIYTILMFRQCIMLEDFFELLMALCGQKCAKLFASHEQLLEFVKERCKTKVKIEEKGSRVFLSWAEANDGSKRLHDQLVIIGKRVCSESAPQKGC